MELYIKPASTVPKFQQIANQVAAQINTGGLKAGDKLPSIDHISQLTGVARQTVVQAYKHLKLQGMVESSKTRGFYVQHPSGHQQRLRVMVLFNILSPSKEIIYNAITGALKERAQTELYFHNYNIEMFENILRSKADMFHYFIVMPHHDPRTMEILQRIPPEKLILIDRPTAQPIAGASSIHQDFKADVFDALMKESKRISRYKQIVLLFPDDKNLPVAIKEGVRKFGLKGKIPVVVAKKTNKKLVQRGSLFITVNDDMLIALIELQQQTSLKLGQDIGIISYNESPLKRILAGGIATLSSDFEQMGASAAICILHNTPGIARNPFKLIVRNSL